MQAKLAASRLMLQDLLLWDPCMSAA